MGPEKNESSPDAGDEFSADELAAIEQMQRETPMPTSNEGGDPPANDPAPEPEKKVDGEDDVELEDGEEELTIDGQGRAHDKAGQFVSKSALLRVKEQRKQALAELESERAARAKIEGRLDILTDIINAVPGDGKKLGEQKTENPWDESDINEAEDLLGALQQQRRRERFNYERQKAIESGQADRDKALAERDKITTLVQSYVADAKRLAAENIKNGELVEIDGGQKIPAFQAAYQHVVALRHAQLEAGGMTDKATRDQHIAQEERQLVEGAAATKRSPAELIMAYAKASGFKMPAKAATNGKDAGKTQAQIEAEKKLEVINKAKANSQTLSGKGGQAYGGVTRSQIIKMDEDEFAALINKLSESELNRMLGAE
jgi:hypothetical protein